MRTKFTSVLLTLLIGVGATQANEGGHAASWQRESGNEVANLASLQRGAKNFMAYCSGCHSLKYARYSRVAEDLKISDELRDQFLVRPGAKFTDYIRSSLPEQDATEWFGKAPPDLSLVTRYRSPDWVYRFLKGFYVDASRPTGTNNLVLDGASMPAVLSDLEGVKAAVFAQHAAAGGEHGGKAVESFEMVAHGRLKPEEFDGFVRDTVNFLDYAGDPSQVQRRSIGIWAVLFLLVFTAFAWMLKKEYWKDVR